MADKHDCIFMSCIHEKTEEFGLVVTEKYSQEYLDIQADKRKILSRVKRFINSIIVKE